MQNEAPIPVVAALVEALYAAAEAACHPSASNAALYYARILARSDGSIGEEAIRKVSEELADYKSDFNDVPSDERYRERIDAAVAAAKRATNHFICLRRPDLALVLERNRET